MKRTIFIIAALFAFTFSNAQIILEHTFDGAILTNYAISEYRNSYTMSTPIPEAPYLFTCQSVNDSSIVKLYDIDTYELYKAITIPYSNARVMFLTRNIFTTDGKVAFATTQNQYIRQIIDEDGNLIFDFRSDSEHSYYCSFYSLIQLNGAYKLLISNYSDHGSTYLFSLPGYGDDNSEVTTMAPSLTNSPSAHKITRNGHVLVQTGENIYNMQGQGVN